MIKLVNPERIVVVEILLKLDAQLLIMSNLFCLQRVQLRFASRLACRPEVRRRKALTSLSKPQSPPRELRACGSKMARPFKMATSSRLERCGKL